MSVFRLAKTAEKVHNATLDLLVRAGPTIRAARNIQPNTLLARLAPFATAVRFDKANNYCHHCFRRLGGDDQPGPIASRYTFDFFGYKSCRNLFDDSERKYAAILRSELRSRFSRREDGYCIAGMSEVYFNDASELTFTYLVAETLVRIINDDDKDADFHIQRMEFHGKPNKLNPIVPNADDFEALKVPTFEINERDQKVSSIISTVLHEHDADMKRHFDDKFIESVVRRVRYNHTSIYRLYDDDDDLHMPAIGLFPAFSAMTFTNSANCDYGFDFNGNIELRSRMRIRQGEEVAVDFQAREITEMLDRSDEEEIPF